MRIVCRGNWAGNQHALLVFRDDGRGGPDSDTICIPCRDAMLATLRAEKEAKNERSGLLA